MVYPCEEYIDPIPEYSGQRDARLIAMRYGKNHMGNYRLRAQVLERWMKATKEMRAAQESGDSERAFAFSEEVQFYFDMARAMGH